MVTRCFLTVESVRGSYLQWFLSSLFPFAVVALKLDGACFPVVDVRVNVVTVDEAFWLLALRAG